MRFLHRPKLESIRLGLCLRHNESVQVRMRDMPHEKFKRPFVAQGPSLRLRIPNDNEEGKDSDQRQKNDRALLWFRKHRAVPALVNSFRMKTLPNQNTLG